MVGETQIVSSSLCRRDEGGVGILQRHELCSTPRILVWMKYFGRLPVSSFDVGKTSSPRHAQHSVECTSFVVGSLLPPPSFGLSRFFFVFVE